jgi:orotidine-5'-phosphate decarboxylase
LVKELVSVGITHFKVGLGLFTLYGPSAVAKVHESGGQVFLDLKFHDIPTTVGRAISAAVRLGVWMTDLHIQGGSGMMRQAVRSAQEEAAMLKRKVPLIVGVTVLTSMAQRDLVDLGLRKTLKDQVLYLAKLAKSAGLNGIVASPREATGVRWTCGEGFLIVTPGIRLATPDPFSSSAPLPSPSRGEGASRDDQQRTATASEAIRTGADFLVVGRPILERPDPVEAARAIIRELEGA